MSAQQNSHQSSTQNSAIITRLDHLELRMTHLEENKDTNYRLLSTKINSFEKENEKEHKRLHEKLDAIDEKIEKLDAKINNKTECLDSKIDNKIDNLESKMNKKIDDLESKLNNKFDEFKKDLKWQLGLGATIVTATIALINVVQHFLS